MMTSLMISGLVAPNIAEAKIGATYSPQHVVVRKYPYPFDAMLAIDSDADHSDLRKFNEVHKFLDTFAETPMGRGLGLDIADSFFLHNGSNLNAEIDYNGATETSEMTMFNGTSNTPSIYAPILLHYIRHGWIDTFHSAGDYSQVDQYQTAFTRSQEAYALNWLAKQHVPAITDFSDHGNMSNVANFGAYADGGLDASQEGDNPQSPYYITDLLHKEGVKFVWNSRLYDGFSNASMLFPIQLRDGSWIWGYHRYTGSSDWAGNELWNPYDLPQELSHANLAQLIQSQGYAIVATHLEGNADKQPLSGSAIETFVHLAHLQDQGKILVARTSRLLWYNLVQQGLVYHVYSAPNLPVTYINVTKINDPVDGNFVPTWQELRGITWFIPHPDVAVVLVNGQAVPSLDTTRTKGTIGIAWYPADTTNWAVALNSPTYSIMKQEMNTNQ
jgi:hypothetical protein